MAHELATLGGGCFWCLEAVYTELRGVELVGTGALITDQDQVMTVAESVSERYTGPVTEQARGFLAKQALKRVVVRIDVERVVSWDHRKLGGVY